MSFPAIDNMPPILPGEFLREEIEAVGMSTKQLAMHIGESTSAVSGILSGRRKVSGLIALKLSRAFGTTPQYWLNLQNMYDTKSALAKHANDIRMIKRL